VSLVAGRVSGLALRIVTAAALIAALLAALFLLPSTGLVALVALLVALAAFEWARLCQLGTAAASGYAVAMAVALLAAYYTSLWQPAFALAGIFWIVVAPLWMWRGVTSAHANLLAAAGFVVLVPTGLAMVTLRPLEVLLVMVLVWIADTAAYFVGRRFGRRKLAPAISPGKTREGAIGGLIGALAYAIICGSQLEGIAWVPYLAAAALIAVLSIVGDLFESAAKRQAEVKDSGAILPGHGGLMDRIDSLTATLPAAALLLPWVRA
jgi:phosphatidate cytidylyltransferase